MAIFIDSLSTRRGNQRAQKPWDSGILDEASARDK
jgi:hypothetical protein